MARQSELDPAEIGKRLREIAGCIRCGNTIGVQLEDSCTMYPFDGKPGSADNPNRPVPLCRPCAVEHYAYWDERWTEYYGGLL